MSGWSLGLAVGAVKVDGGRRIRPVPRAVVPRIDPEPPGLGSPAAGIEHRNGRVVGEQLGRREDLVGKPCLQRLQPPAGAADPACQGRPLDRGAVPSEDLGLSIERRVVAVLADQHLGDEPRRSQALGDRTVGCRRLMNRAAGAAAILGATDAHHAKLSRNPVEHFARGLADRVKVAATARALIALHVEHDILAREMTGKCRALRHGSRIRGRLTSRQHRVLGFRTGNIGVQVFDPEGQLIGIEALGPASELPSLKLLDDTLETLDLVIAGLDNDRHVAHQAVQKVDIRRQVSEFETHERF